MELSFVTFASGKFTKTAQIIAGVIARTKPPDVKGLVLCTLPARTR